MTQHVPDPVVREEVATATGGSVYEQAIYHDLLSLRAAVRRVLEAIVSERDEGTLAPWQVLRFVEDALRAEMAGIDKDGGA